MSKSLTIFKRACAVVFLSLIASLPASANPDDQTCNDNGNFTVCIKSASINDSGDHGQFNKNVQVSLTLELVNKTDYPMDIVLLNESQTISFAPHNAVALFNYGPLSLAGLHHCKRQAFCTKPKTERTAFYPNTPLSVQLSYPTRIMLTTLPQLQLANKASFSATLYIVDNSKNITAVPISIAEFGFANGFTK